MRENEKRLDLDILVAQMSSYCAFSLGKEYLLNLEPSFNKLIIKRDLAIMKEALELTIKYNEMPFNGFRDIKNALYNTLKDRIITTNDCMNVISHLEGIKAIFEYFKDYKEEYINLDELVSSIFYDKKFLDFLNGIFNEYGEIKDSATVELSSIRNKLRKLEGEIYSTSERFKKDYANRLVDGIITTRDNRVVVLAKNSDKNTIGGFIHGESASGQAAYVEPPIFIELNNKKISLLSQEEAEIEKILWDCSREIKKYADYILANLETVAILDSFFARALWGKNNECTTADLVSEKNIIIKKARHPLIDKNKVVSNSYNIKNPHNVLLITGPNTGGKSVSLKIIGLMVLMSYSGMPIPCEEATIPFFDKLFIDIGDEQSVVESLSTFSSHLSKLAEICDNATSKSLVLLDELGSGTDPKEGESLAIAILNELRERKCMIVATTHYGRLKSYGKKHDDILVASVEFDLQSLSPTYRFIEGITGQSNAFDIASRYGLSDKIIKYAKFLKEQNKSSEENLMEKLEKQLLEANELKDRLESELLEAQKAKEDALKLKEALENKKEEFIENAKLEAELYLEEKREEADYIIAELRKQVKNNVKYHEALSIKKQLDAEENTFVDDTDSFKVGDTVLIKSSNQVGIITNIKKNQVSIDVRGINIVSKIGNLKHSNVKINKPIIKTSVNSFKITEAKLECNLIGKTVEEALIILDKFLDNAKFAKMPMVRIIHGDGSGALRKAVHDRLRIDKSIKEFRLGMPNEGGSGATVVSF